MRIHLDFELTELAEAQRVLLLLGSVSIAPGATLTGHVHTVAAHTHTGTLTDGPDARDPAAVFAAGNVAPSGAAVTALQIAPEGQTVISVMPLPGATPLAQLPGPQAGASLAAPTSHANGVLLDKDGIPWDSRIHANAAEKMAASGYWKKRKGLNDEAYVNGIVAELKQAMAATGAPVATAAATPVSLLPAPPAGSVAPAVVLPVPPSAAAIPPTFETIMPKLGNAAATGVITMPEILQAVQLHGLPTIPAMQTRPDLVPQIWDYLVSIKPALAGV